MPSAIGAEPRGGFRANADDADVGPQRLGRARHAGEQAAAADRHDQRVDLGTLAQHLERDRAAARDDGRIVVRMDHGRAADDRERLRVQGRFAVGLALEDDGRTELTRAPDLDVGRCARHDDRGRHVQAPGVIRQALRVVAGRCRDHAARLLRFRQLQQRVERAPFFERTGELQLFELETDLDADRFGEPRCVAARRHRDRTVDANGRRPNVVDGKRVLHQQTRNFIASDSRGFASFANQGIRARSFSPVSSI